MKDPAVIVIFKEGRYTVSQKEVGISASHVDLEVSLGGWCMYV
jgi:hypothetical protein